MAKGTLGTATYLSSTAATIVYTVPSDKAAVITLNICNKLTTSISLNVGIERGGNTGVLSEGEYIEYSTAIPGNSVMERSGILLSSNDSIVVSTDTVNALNVNIWGLEE